MKIINQTYRNVLQDELFNKTPISELQQTSELYETSLIHIVQRVGELGNKPKYESMKMTIKDFEQKIYEAVQNTFKTRYWDTHEYDAVKNEPSLMHDQEEKDLPESLKDASFAEMVKYLGPDAPAEVEATDIDGFVDHVFYDFDVVKRYIVKKNNWIKGRLDRIETKIIELDYAFDPDMRLFTTDADGEVSQVSVNHHKTENDKLCQMEIKDGNKISNEWTCPASGNLVVYGWLDSSSALNNKAIPSAYCVLEAKILAHDAPKDDDDTDSSDSELNEPDYTPDSSDFELDSSDSSIDDGVWEIISAQPVIPAKNITYVGFNVPVHEGLVIRARTGFTVGAKSGQYSNENDGFDTLSNLTPNGFKCMIFSNQMYLTSMETKEREEKRKEKEREEEDNDTSEEE